MLRLSKSAFVKNFSDNLKGGWWRSVTSAADSDAGGGLIMTSNNLERASIQVQASVYTPISPVSPVQSERRLGL